MKLADLTEGHRAVISAIEEQNLAARLNEFGVFSGSIVRFIGTAPSGCPILLEAGGTQFGLRKEQAQQIKIAQLD